jgi:hypothetical protein
VYLWVYMCQPCPKAPQTDWVGDTPQGTPGVHSCWVTHLWATLQEGPPAGPLPEQADVAAQGAAQQGPTVACMKLAQLLAHEAQVLVAPLCSPEGRRQVHVPSCHALDIKFRLVLRPWASHVLERVLTGHIGTCTWRVGHLHGHVHASQQAGLQQLLPQLVRCVGVRGLQ